MGELFSELMSSGPTPSFDELLASNKELARRLEALRRQLDDRHRQTPLPLSSVSDADLRETLKAIATGLQRLVPRSSALSSMASSWERHLEKMTRRILNGLWVNPHTLTRKFMKKLDKLETNETAACGGHR